MSLFNRLFSRNSQRAYNVAMEAYNHGDYETAITKFREVLRSAAEGSTAYILSRFFVTQCRVHLATAFLQSGHLDEAHATLIEVMKQHPEFPDIHCRLGEIAVLREQFKEAEMRFKRAIAINEYYLEPRLALGSLYRRLDRREDAVEHLRRIADSGTEVPRTWMTASPGDDDPETIERVRVAMTRERESAEHLRKAMEHYHAGDLESALISYEYAVEVNPGHPDIRCRLASVLGEVGRMPEAIQQFTRALEQNPAYEEARLKRGVALFQLGRFEEAVTDFEDLFDRNPSNAEICLLFGICLHRVGRSEEAIGHLRVASKDPSVSTRAVYFLAQAYVMLDQPDRAIACLDGVQVPACQAMLGRLLIHQRRYHDATRTLSRARAGRKKPGDLSIALATAYYRAGDLDFAERFAEEALEHDATADEAGMVLARVAFQRGQDEVVRDRLEKVSPALRLGYDGQVLTARALARVGRAIEAQAVFEKALETHPPASEAQRALGLLMWRKGRTDEARRFLSASVNDPVDPLWGMDLGRSADPAHGSMPGSRRLPRAA